jgi:oxepin-CoA hydrolase/3-oxo-5,6-dehydrosuberyl-CoA semialdehyde dehydrogenase
VRVNVEADSLNAALLGPEVEPRSDMYELFLKDVVRDMTQKAGQKCTAIRRVLVPKEKISAVRDDLAELLSQVRVGNPAEAEIRMGPLATASQLDDAHKGVARLNGELAFGNLDRQSRGYFISPILIESPGDAVHEHEVFGPVASLLPYENDPGAVVARGNGGLVCSVYSEEQNFLQETIQALAPFHGRIFIGHPKIELSPGPGTVLPQLVHGGPGRAGGGEELGGERGLHAYMQRTALEGDTSVLKSLLGA